MAIHNMHEIVTDVLSEMQEKINPPGGGNGGLREEMPATWELL